jgi:tetratricopeptide (TPR) repeat protein
MRFPFSRILTALVMLACSAAVVSLPAQQTAVQKLEAARTANPNSIAALRALGVAYYKANRFADARTVLDHARRLDPRDGVSALYAGLSAEALGDFTNAKTAYNDYLRVGRTRRVRNQISQRLVALSRNEVIASAKAAVANEATLSQTPGDRRVVAVPPLKFTGPDAETLAPLERGLADMIITDLGHSSQLTLVERDRMQALADEIQLGASDRVDAATGARAGRLMQAGRLISGSIVQTGNDIRLTSSIVDVATSQIGEAVEVPSPLDALFDAEKQLVLRIFEQLGVTLTPAERQLVDRRPTSNLQAFLAYSRGLQAVDDGRFEDASRFFDNARALDPGFGAASARFNAAQAAIAGAAVTTSTIESSLTGAEGATVGAAEQGNTGPAGGGTETTLNRVAQDVNPPSVVQTSNDTRVTGGGAPGGNEPKRDGPSTTTGTDQPTARNGQVTVVIRRP